MPAHRQTHQWFTSALGMACLAAIVSCTANSGLPTPTPSASATAIIVGTVTTVRAATPAPELTPPPPPPATLNVNTASANDLRALFTRNSIINASQYANAIEANRPYPADDKDWSRLREALAQEKAPPATIDKIVSLLTR